MQINRLSLIAIEKQPMPPSLMKTRINREFLFVTKRGETDLFADRSIQSAESTDQSATSIRDRSIDCSFIPRIESMLSSSSGSSQNTSKVSEIKNIIIIIAIAAVYSSSN